MGQKANPNSFRATKKTAVNFLEVDTQMNEYSTLLKEYLLVSSNIVTFFEKIIVL